MAKKQEEPKEEPQEQPKKKAEPVDDTPQGLTIDERMANLLEDHKKMGAR